MQSLLDYDRIYLEDRGERNFRPEHVFFGFSKGGERNLRPEHVLLGFSGDLTSCGGAKQQGKYLGDSA